MPDMPNVHNDIPYTIESLATAFCELQATCARLADENAELRQAILAVPGTGHETASIDAARRNAPGEGTTIHADAASSRSAADPIEAAGRTTSATRATGVIGRRALGKALWATTVTRRVAPSPHGPNWRNYRVGTGGAVGSGCAAPGVRLRAGGATQNRTEDLGIISAAL